MTATPTLLTALRQHAADAPERVAVHFIASGERSALTYGVLYEEACSFAALYRAAGVSLGDVVLIMLPHRRDLYPAFLGAMLVGACPAMLPFPTPKQHPEAFWTSHRRLFARIEPAFVLSYEAIREALTDALPAGTPLATIETLDLDALQRSSDAAPLVVKDPLNAVALLQHSSGTTGLKKGVMLSYGQIARQVESYSRVLGFSRDDVVASWLPLYHDMGLISSFLMPISLGATIVSLDPFDWVSQPLSLFDEVARYRASFVWMPNFAFSHIRQHFEILKPMVPDLSSLRAVISCSEPVRADTIAKFRETFAPLGLADTAPQACYAMAETVFAVSQSPLDRPARVLHVSRSALDSAEALIVPVAATDADAAPLVSNGPVVSGLAVRIAGRDGTWQVATGKDSASVGEIQISGDFLFSGYYRASHLDAMAFTADGWYRTGDLGFCEGGELFICGREKELLIVHGKNFYAGDIEQLVSVIPGVKPGRVVVFAVHDVRSDTEECVVMAETEEVNSIGQRDLKRMIKSAVYDGLALMVRSIELVEVGTLAKTTSGKMSRSENRSIYMKKGQ